MARPSNAPNALWPLRPDAKLPIGLQLKVVIFLMIGVGAMNSGVQATPKQWGLSRIDCLVNPTLMQHVAIYCCEWEVRLGTALRVAFVVVVVSRQLLFRVCRCNPGSQ